MPARKRKRSSSVSTAQVDAFTAGGIIALRQEVYSQRQIADSGAVDKPDGGEVTYGLVGQIIRHWEADPYWRGERSEGSGRLRATTAAEDKAMVNEIVQKRGKEKMTSTVVQRRVARKVSRRTVRRRLREAGLRWLRRRRKTWVPERSREQRLAWKDRVKASSDKFLKRWVYTDGIGFYKDRSQDELDELKHKALGL